MNNLSKIALVLSAFAFSSAANAQTFSPVGTHKFEGTLKLKKTLPDAFCDVSLDFIIAPDGSATINNAVVGGAAIGCNLINFTGAPYTIVPLTSGPPTDLFALNFRVDIDGVPSIPLAPDACEGTLRFELGSNGTAATLEFVDVKSDVPGVPGGTPFPCKIEGVLIEQDPHITTVS